MKETDAQQSTALDWISLTFKIFYFLIPPTLVETFFPHGHYVLYGASFIGGALLQALWPPRTPMAAALASPCGCRCSQPEAQRAGRRVTRVWRARC